MTVSEGKSRAISDGEFQTTSGEASGATPLQRPANAPRIACIGWGSLLWDPRSLPTAAPFRDDGPMLPIEFSRVAKDGRVTLVIDPEAAPMQTFWCELTSKTIDEAVSGLGQRERIAPARWSEWVAFARRSPFIEGEVESGGYAVPETRREIQRWLEVQSIDAVVWTALPARRPNGDFGWPTTEELVEHLEGLTGEARSRAEEYIRRTPETIRSVRRARFEASFGWMQSALPSNTSTPGVEEVRYE